MWEDGTIYIRVDIILVLCGHSVSPRCQGIGANEANIVYLARHWHQTNTRLRTLQSSGQAWPGTPRILVEF